jgi:hypothetical protein
MILPTRFIVFIFCTFSIDTFARLSGPRTLALIFIMMSSLARLHSCVTPIVTRAASTQARSLSTVLSKNPEDVVITFAKRTPIGRSKKGQFKNTPIDEILYGLFKVRLQNET